MVMIMGMIIAILMLAVRPKDQSVSHRILILTCGSSKTIPKIPPLEDDADGKGYEIKKGLATIEMDDLL